MPYVTDAKTTYSLLTILVVAHIALNYFAVHTVVLRSLNRQRAGLLWHAYRTQKLLQTTPTKLASQERIFAQPSLLYCSTPGSPRTVVGECHIGSPLSSILPQARAQASWWKSGRPALWVAQADPSWVASLLERFADENFIVWFDRRAHSRPVLHIILKDGHTPQDQLKAWVLATEVASRCTAPKSKSVSLGDATIHPVAKEDPDKSRKELSGSALHCESTR